MLLVLELDVADLAATRFAISPLSETVRAVQLLGGRNTPAVNAPWARWAHEEGSAGGRCGFPGCGRSSSTACPPTRNSWSRRLR